jgi:hypothetical protein
LKINDRLIPRPSLFFTSDQLLLLLLLCLLFLLLLIVIVFESYCLFRYSAAVVCSLWCLLTQTIHESDDEAHQCIAEKEEKGDGVLGVAREETDVTF